MKENIIIALSLTVLALTTCLLVYTIRYSKPPTINIVGRPLCLRPLP